MDNVCHTLAGLAIGETGLKKKTALASFTLMIGANLPDVDAFIYFFRPESAIGFRRGWTHGILAMAVWPFVLTAVVLLLGRLLKKQPDPRGVLLLSALSIWSHPVLDLMNTYGVRLLMPFSGTWFYGDTLFIIDLWVWLALLAGIILARRAQKAGSNRPFRPARVAVAGVSCYIVLMAAIGTLGRGVVRRALVAQQYAVQRIMVGPLPLTPLRRQVVAEVLPPGAAHPDSIAYAEGALVWNGVIPRFALYGVRPANASGPEARRAAATAGGRTFLIWARFPFYDVGPDQECPAGFVCIRDMRYFPQEWAEVAVPIAGDVSSSASPRASEQP